MVIGGSVFACLGGFLLWYRKMLGEKLKERMGKWLLWMFMMGLNICLLGEYLLGVEGMAGGI